MSKAIIGYVLRLLGLFFGLLSLVLFATAINFAFYISPPISFLTLHIIIFTTVILVIPITIAFGYISYYFINRSIKLAKSNKFEISDIENKDIKPHK